MVKKHRSSTGRLYAMIMIGTGLVAMGIMLFIIFDRKDPVSSSNFSVVPAEVDFAAPELDLQTLGGQPASLSEYHGEVVLVNLWATWCPPCREEMPALLAFYEKYKEQGFVLIAINQEEPEDVVAAFVNQFGLSFPVWLDPYYSSQRKFNTMNLPSSYVIDRWGRVRLMWVGGISEKNLENYVSKLIRE